MVIAKLSAKKSEPMSRFIICFLVKLFRVVQRLLYGGNHFALNRKRFAGNSRARRSRMSAAAELRGDFVHVHLVAFRAQADAREFGFDLLEDARDDDRLDGAD